MDIGALYVHVPFCVRKCAYCDFASDATPRNDPCLDAYVSARIHELERCKELDLLDSCTTAYIGGGTPSMLGAPRLSRLIACIRFVAPRITEFTCEANPESLDDAVLEALLDSHVTRLSIGVQSLEDDELRELGRIHTADLAVERVSAAVAHGFDVSVDLMCAIPCQTSDSWLRTLRRTIDLGVSHISVYPLSLEDGTPMARRFANATCPWNDENTQADRMEMAERELERAGYERYEVASYARAGHECAHNTAYWTGIPYLGLGRGAASMLDATVYDIARNLYPWLPTNRDKATRMRFSTLDREVEFMSAREAWAEDLMLGMRLTRGIECGRLDCVPEIRDDLIDRGLIQEAGGRLIPTHEGWLLGNELYGALWDLR